MSKKIIQIDDESSGIGDRLDRFLASECPDLSRSRIQALIKDGDITVNGRATKPKAQIGSGDVISIAIPAPVEAQAQPEDISLDVLYEDNDLLVVNKAHGMVVHPAAGNADGTLVNALLYHCKGSLSSIGGVTRPGIVHRLDKDTSGCIVVAKNDKAHQSLTTQFSERTTSKIYLAVVNGRPAMMFGRLENNIARSPRDRQKMAVVFPPAGKIAITEYTVRDPRADATLVECRIFTGRTHQIRVHMLEIGNPILGDPIYAKPARQNVPVPRLMLHAWKLSFEHPATGAQMSMEAPIPPEFSPWL
jgi:23S rRNA pseudouridine1911/1915/1917 synthase